MSDRRKTGIEKPRSVNKFFFPIEEKRAIIRKLGASEVGLDLRIGVIFEKDQDWTKYQEEFLSKRKQESGKCEENAGGSLDVRIRTRSRVIFPRFKNFLTAEGSNLKERLIKAETEETGGMQESSDVSKGSVEEYLVE